MKNLLVITFLIIFSVISFGNNVDNSVRFLKNFLNFSYYDALYYVDTQFITEEYLKKLYKEIDENFGEYLYTSGIDRIQNDKIIKLYNRFEKLSVLIIVYFDQKDKIFDVIVENVDTAFELMAANLEISTFPEGASIYLDNIFEGFSPLNLKLTQGNYDLKIRKNDYLSINNRIQINSGDNIVMNLNLLPDIRVDGIIRQIANSKLLNSMDTRGWNVAQWTAENVIRLNNSNVNVTEGRANLQMAIQTSKPSEIILQYNYSITPKNTGNSKIFFADVFWHSDDEAYVSLAFQNGPNWKWIETNSVKLNKGLNKNLYFYSLSGDNLNDIKVLNIKFWTPQDSTRAIVYIDNIRYY